ncbi:MAG: putative bifunctional diguanylate cyclase/phosphodiesterase [Thermoanaerobaculia bacterium]
MRTPGESAPSREEESRALEGSSGAARVREVPERFATRSVNRLATSFATAFALAAILAALLGIFGLETVSTFRAYAAAESRWSRAEASSLLVLAGYLDSSDEKDHEKFLASQEIPKAFHRALDELERPVIEPGPAAEALVASGCHPDEVDGMVSVLTHLENFGEAEPGLSLCRELTVLGQEIAALGEQIREEVASHRLDAARRLARQQEIESLGARLSNVSERFTAQVGLATRGVRRRLAAALVVLMLLTTGLAISVSVRVARLLRSRQHDLEASERRYRLLFERNLAGLYRATLDGRILECNSALARILGRPTREEVLELNMHELYLDSEDREVTIATLLQQKFLVNYEIGLRRRDGSPVWVLVNESLLEEETGGPVLEGSLIDITDRKRAEEESHHQAHHDALTDLPNRVLFHDRLSLAILHAHRRKQSLAVMFIDLDHFKNVNDTLGHSSGDEVLVAVAERLRGCLREEDTVARVGGDEFLLLLTGITREGDVAGMARKILKVLAEPFTLKKRELFLSASIGVGLYPNDGTDAETLVANVDTAMYRAKEAGRNNYQFFTPHMQEASQERAHLESGLRRALPRREFALHYQPVLELASRRVLGLEALVRWNHPERGLLGPKEFIGLAEDAGLIVSIGDWILHKACEEARRLQLGAFPELRMSVNLSPRQFHDKDLVWTVQRILAETGLPPTSLELEITEGIAMQDLSLTMEVLGELTRMGIQISVDDFGTGHSSLNYLKHFPIHRLKIDRSFVAGMTRDDRDRSIVAAIVSMAHNLSLRVTGEGVETTAQAEMLAALGCDDVQGFLFAPPLPEASLEERLAAVSRATLA